MIREIVVGNLPLGEVPAEPSRDESIRHGDSCVAGLPDSKAAGFGEGELAEQAGVWIECPVNKPKGSLLNGAVGRRVEDGQTGICRPRA